MRTVTFSEKSVARFVNENFVAAWHDRGPGFCNTDYNTEKWIYQGQYESYPTKNIATFFLDPDASVFFYASGYWAPDFFMEIAKSALRLRDDPKQAKSLAIRSELIVSSLSGKAASKDAPKADWCKTHSYRGLNHSHNSWCRQTTSAGFAYLGKLFRAFAEMKERPALIDVATNYVSGNEFTEESGQNRAIDPASFVATVDDGKDETPAAPAAPPPMTKREKRRAELKERVEALNAHLLDMALDAPERAGLQNELIALLDEMTR